jgi:MFS family permease
MLFQYPIGWLSDRMDRRQLIAALTTIGAVVTFGGVVFQGGFIWLLALSFVIGGIANPLYSLYLAYTSDFLDSDDMAAASGGLIFINGIGAISGPILLGAMMDFWGPFSFFGYIGGVLALMALYATYRMTQRAAPSVEDTSSYSPIAPTSSPVAVEVAQELAIEMALEEESNINDTGDET